jgi:hypothetical protein
MNYATAWLMTDNVSAMFSAGLRVINFQNTTNERTRYKLSRTD